MDAGSSTALVIRSPFTRSTNQHNTTHMPQEKKRENERKKNWMLNDAQNTKMDFKNVPNRPHTWLNGCSAELTTPCHAWKSSIYAYFREKKYLQRKSLESLRPKSMHLIVMLECCWVCMSVFFSGLFISFVHYISSILLRWISFHCNFPK